MPDRAVVQSLHQRLTRTVRVFISSTFRDFIEERNALNDSVYPRLRKLCARHGWLFDVIDLRWGVSEAAAVDQSVMKICLEEVVRCQQISPRPNFIALLGDRYGSYLLPEIIPTTEFEQIDGSLKLTRERELLHRWYRLDQNAVSPTHVLRPRFGRFKELQVWSEEVEQPLRRILTAALDGMSLSHQDRLKYFGSATEQEIELGVFQQADSNEHVYAFFRTINNLPEDSRARNFTHIGPDGIRDVRQTERLRNLKERIAGKLGASNIFHYEADWVTNGITTAHLESLCEDVYRSLKKVIEREIEQFGSTDSSLTESLHHNKFGEERTKGFVGRDKPLADIAEYLKSNSQCAFAVFGESGTGKTSLLAESAERALSSWPNARVAVRFIGATSESTNTDVLVGSIIRQLNGEASPDPQDTFIGEKLFHKEIDDLAQEFEKTLAVSTATKPTIVFIDALNQLTDVNYAQNLSWLPVKLPSHSYLIVSTADAHNQSVLEKLLPEQNVIKLSAMEPHEALRMLDCWLEVDGRRLSPPQRDTVVSRLNDCGLPLYVKFIFEQARNWRSYDRPRDLADGVDGILKQYFKQLGNPRNHGELLVSKCLSYLQAARRGLSDTELLDLLGLDDEYYSHFIEHAQHALPNDNQSRQLPAVVWLRLYADLKPYLSERAYDGTSLINFYHSFLSRLVEKQFLPPKKKLAVHRALARYFSWASLDGVEHEEIAPSRRCLSELPYQQAEAQMTSELVATLNSYDFISAKCEAQLVDDLLLDYQRARISMPHIASKVREWERFIASRTHLLRRASSGWSSDRTLLQLSTECSSDSTMRRSAEEWLNKSRNQTLRLADVSRPENPYQRVLEGHWGVISGALLLRNGQMVTWALDPFLIIWDLESSVERLRLEGHTIDIIGVLELSNGNLLSWSWDKTLLVWNAQTGAIQATLEGHTEGVIGARLLDGSKVVSWGSGTELILWDLETCRLLARLEGHSSRIFDVVPLPNRRIVSASSDNVLAWNLEDLTSIKAPGVSDIEMENLAVLEDGRCIWSGAPHVMIIELKNDEWESFPSVGWSQEGGNTFSEISGAIGLSGGEIVSWEPLSRHLSVWLTMYFETSSSGRSMEPASTSPQRGITYRAGLLSGHERPVVGAQVLSNEKFISWSKDNTLILWEISRVRLSLDELVEKKGGQFVRIMGDGRLVLNLISGAPELHNEDEDVADSIQGFPRMRFTGHAGPIKGALIMPDETLLSWSDDGTIRLWEVATGKCLRILKTPSGGVDEIIMLPDGRFVSFSRQRPELVVWDNEAQETGPSNVTNSKRVLGCQYFDEGRMISWSEDNSLRMWDTETGVCLNEFKGHSRPIKGAIRHEKQNILTWSSDGTLRIWSPESGECLSVLSGHERAIISVLPMPGGTLLSWSDDFTLRIWNTAGTCRALLEGHEKKIIDARIVPNERVVSWSRDNTIKLWDYAKANRSGVETTEVLRPVVDCRGHEKAVGGVFPLSNRLLSWSWDGTLRIWNQNTGECLQVLKQHRDSINGALVLPDERIISWSDDATICVWDGSSGRLMSNLRGHESGITGVQFISQSLIVSRARDGTMRCWDIDLGTCVDETRFGANIVGTLLVRDGNLFAWSNELLYSWDTLTPPLPSPIDPSRFAVGGHWELDFSRKLFWSFAGECLLWDNQTGLPIETTIDLEAQPHSGLIVGMWQQSSFSVLPDGRLLFPIKLDRFMLWDPYRGTGYKLRLKHQNMITPLLRYDPLGQGSSRASVLADAVPYRLRLTLLGRNQTCIWHTDRHISKIQCLLPNGTVILSLKDGAFAFLKLLEGKKRVPLFR